MARRFDLYRTADGDFVVVLQSDLLEDLDTRAVCPAAPESRQVPGFAALSPVLMAGDVRLRIVPHVVATLTVAEPGTFLLSLAHERDRSIRVVDSMLTGA